MDINYTQLCCWPGTTLGEITTEQFEKDMFEIFNVKVKFAEITTTLPDKDKNGNNIPNTGGRSDLLFHIHNEDIQKFATARLVAGIRWWEDVIKYNDNSHLYTSEILKKYKPTW